jgi:hypothetical protein
VGTGQGDFIIEADLAHVEPERPHDHVFFYENLLRRAERETDNDFTTSSEKNKVFTIAF